MGGGGGGGGGGIAIIESAPGPDLEIWDGDGIEMTCTWPEHDLDVVWTRAWQLSSVHQYFCSNECNWYVEIVISKVILNFDVVLFSSLFAFVMVSYFRIDEVFCQAPTVTLKVILCVTLR